MEEYGEFKENAGRFAQLFRGSDLAHGHYTLGAFDKAKNKREGKASTEKGAAALVHFENHLKGETGLGVIPITSVNLCNFGVIDIDDRHPTLFDEITERLENAKLLGYFMPFVICRSKSNGLHFYVFCNEAVPAALLQKVLRQFAITIGYPKAEVFPKQVEIKADKGEYGNWINLPYFGSNTRHCLNEVGKPISFVEFLNSAEESRISAATLERFEKNPIPDILGCSFTHENIANAETIERNLWWAQTGIHGVRGEDALAHQISSLDQGRYKPDELDKLLAEAKEKNIPHHCQTLVNDGFTCPKMNEKGKCTLFGVISPAYIGRKAPLASTPVSTEADEPWAEPTDFLNISHAVPLFPDNFMPGVFGEMIDDIAHRLQVPKEFSAISMLVGVATILGTNVIIYPKMNDTKWWEFPCLWGTIINPPGFKKSPTFKAALAPLYEIQRALDKQYDAELAQYKVELATYKNTKPPHGAPPTEPIAKKIIVQDTTVEALALTMSQNPDGIALIRDELSAWLNGLNKYSGGKDDRAFFLEAWSAGYWSSNRKTSQSVRVDNMFLNICGTIQPEVARSLFSNSTDGMTQRFGLLAFPAEKYGEYVDEKPNLKAEESVKNRIIALRAALNPTKRNSGGTDDETL